MKALAEAIGRQEAAATVRAMMPEPMRELADALRERFDARLSYMRVGDLQVGEPTPVDPDKVWRPGDDFAQRMRNRNSDGQAKTRAQRQVATLRYK